MSAAEDWLDDATASAAKRAVLTVAVLDVAVAARSWRDSLIPKTSSAGMRATALLLAALERLDAAIGLHDLDNQQRENP